MSKVKKRIKKIAYFLFLVTLVPLGFAIPLFFKYWSGCEEYSQRIGSEFLPSNEAQEVIVVLTGDKNRISEGLNLLRMRQLDLLIISGTGKNVNLIDIFNQSRWGSEYTRDLWSKVKLEARSTSTIENAIETKNLLNEHPFSRLILVTSDYHMKRALKIFKIVFDREIIPFPVASDFTEKNWMAYWYLGNEFLKNMLFEVHSKRKLLTEIK